ncbi:MAG TPA: hypothetical protein VHB21_25350 [Minicystis sp.]|nr:hypothetical protein [Minicystis sp.]
MKRAAALVAALSLALAACSRKPPDATPEGAVREIVERLQLVRGEPRDARAAFELLSKRAQANLAARAQRYSAASGKPIGPEAMIAPARFALRFEPQRYAAQISGVYALVDVAGPMPEDHAKVPCVFEEHGWRVDVTLPPLPPVQMRPGASPASP